MMTLAAPPRTAPVLDRTRAILADHLGTTAFRLVVVAMSRDDNPKVTVMAVPERASSPALAAKVGTTPTAREAVRREARTLERLATLGSRRLLDSVPRLAALHDEADATLLVATVCPGRPMAMDYHGWRHPGRARLVASDFIRAAGWLLDLHQLAIGSGEPPAWEERLRRRWPGADLGEESAAATGLLAARLDWGATSSAVVHGDYWCGNILVDAATVTGVVDWEHAVFGGDPLRDRVRFALAYTLYLDRHTKPGRGVYGHPGLRRTGWGEPLRYLLVGSGWYQDVVRGFVGDGLRRTGRSPALWRDALVLGLAEIAANSDEEAFAQAHARLLLEMTR